MNATTGKILVILGHPDAAVRATNDCLAAGLRVGCFRPPAVAAGTSRLRLTARASLTDEEIELACTVLTAVLGTGMR